MNLQRLSDHLYKDEQQSLEECLATIPRDKARNEKILARTKDLTKAIRAHKRKPGELDSFMQQYGLTTDEGLALMTMAEALLRIPDKQTANLLIKDKITSADWYKTSGATPDMLVRLAGYGLSVSKATFESMISSLGEPVIRKATYQAMKILGHQFVLGRDIGEAIERGKTDRTKGTRFSYDMLGEGARNFADAEKYYEGYANALKTLSSQNSEIKDNQIGNNAKSRLRRAGISVKLSALYPRYEYAKAEDCVPALIEKMIPLCQQAKAEKLNLTIDAEEVSRLELQLEIFEQLCNEPSLEGWNGLGLAVQAYQKRCLPLIDHLRDIARNAGRKIQVRLVKGAYWDTEIKHAQVEGLPDFPVFTRKANTDVSFLACAKKLLDNRDVFYPMLATHNAHSVLACLEMAGDQPDDYEFQRLHGMGEALYDILREERELPVSIYAPVGTHKDLLPYLVRRLLENGANSSFVNKIADPSVDIDEITQDPVELARGYENKRHPNIRLPADQYPGRKNSKGFDINDDAAVSRVLNDIKTHVYDRSLDYNEILGRKGTTGSKTEMSVNPADNDDVLGQVPIVNEDEISQAMKSATEARPKWDALGAEKRADILDKIADLYEEHSNILTGMSMREGGRALHDSLLEVREAVDFCRYYAMQARQLFEPVDLPGPTGESNILTHEGRGVFVCISPWNFPLAIFTGQIAAALVGGNSVVAKPAEQTPFTAALAVKLMYQAGVPRNVLHLIPGDGEVGAKLVDHPDIAGVCFTGSHEVAKLIHKSLSDRPGPIPQLIAETGGQNAIIVDSTALPEQVVDDVIHSAFYSAGQRCSAARIVLIQEDVAEEMITMLAGAMKTLKLGNTLDISNDIGPVIDYEAREKLEEHKHSLERIGKKLAATPVSPEIKENGTFFAPCLYEIEEISQLKKEVFGPILHVIRFNSENLDNIIQQLNETGYGLTFGVHSRIESRYNDLTKKIRAGNCYVNRSVTGAVVGVQPFGGRGLSGTGPKAGGPHYLCAFVTEKSISVNTAAIGGNASLVGLEE